MNDNIEAAAIRSDLLRTANKSIYASMYMVKPDRSGYRMLAELRAAALRGVEVHFMMDGLYLKKFPDDVIEAVVASGVHLYEFNPFDKRYPKKFLERSHDKVWVTDAEWIDVSDRNMANEYFGLTKDPAISRGIVAQDTKSSAEAIAYMKESFESTASRKRRPRNDTQLAARGGAILDRALANSVDMYFAPFRGWRKKMTALKNLKFNHSGVGTRDSPLDLDAALLEDLKSAKKKIVIENPYIVLIPEHREVLIQKLQDGVKVEIYTNSKFSSDNILVSAAWENSRDLLADYGAEIWEHPGRKKDQKIWAEAKARIRRLKEFKIDGLARSRNFLHAKTVVIDDIISYVMSYNMDPRSKNLNREVSLRAEGPEFAAGLRRAIIGDSKRIKYLNTARNGMLMHDAPRCGILLRSFVETRQIREQL